MNLLRKETERMSQQENNSTPPANNNPESLGVAPEEVVRPPVSADAAVDLVARLYGLKVTSVREQVSYDDKNFRVKVADEWNNSYLKELCPHGYVLKILNSVYSQKKHFEAEHDMQQILLKNGLRCPKAVLNVHGDYKSLEKIDHRENNNASSDVDNSAVQHTFHLVRLMEFVPGDILHSITYTPALIYDVGEYVAKMHTLWKDYHHHALENYNHIWSMESMPSLREFVYAVRDEKYRTYVHKVIDDYEKTVIPNYKHFGKGVLHGDINEQNILVQLCKDQPERTEGVPKEHYVHGMLDFGDALESYYVTEVGIAIAYVSIDSTFVDPLLVAGHLLAGYTKHRSLNDYEFDALKTCVAARLCQSLVMGEHTYSKDPENEYVLTTGKNGWPLLTRLWDTPKDELYAMWTEVMKSYR